MDTQMLLACVVFCRGDEDGAVELLFEQVGGL